MSYRQAPVDTPLTRMNEHWMTHQGNKKCAPLEMDFIRCGARVGEMKVKTECFREWADLQECLNERKQRERLKIMREERKKQGKPYIEKPPEDSFILTQK